MAKYAKPIQGSSVSDYRVIDKKGHYEYKHDTSIVITRNSLETVRAKEIGWSSRAERDKARKSGEYKRWITGSLDTMVKPQFDRDTFEREYVKAKNSKWDTSSNGAFAQFLVWIGYRDTDATYPVGQTPSKKPR